MVLASPSHLLPSCSEVRQADCHIRPPYQSRINASKCDQSPTQHPIDSVACAVSYARPPPSSNAVRIPRSRLCRTHLGDPQQSTGEQSRISKAEEAGPRKLVRRERKEQGQRQQYPAPLVPKVTTHVMGRTRAGVNSISLEGAMGMAKSEQPEKCSHLKVQPRTNNNRGCRP